jgi:hypothetical protein
MQEAETFPRVRGARAQLELELYVGQDKLHSWGATGRNGTHQRKCERNLGRHDTAPDTAPGQLPPPLDLTTADARNREEESRAGITWPAPKLNAKPNSFSPPKERGTGILKHYPTEFR